jgi:hypothetical protein
MRVIAVLRRFAVILPVLLLLDWVIGGMTVAGLLPKWVFAVANVPFGIVNVWFESHWTGNQYLFGHPVSDGVSLLIFVTVIIAQAILYTAIYTVARRRPSLKADPLIGG